MNLKQIAYKLQLALCLQGRRVKINQYQSYSEKAERMVTKYVLAENVKTPEGKRKDITIIESYQIAEVVKALAEIYGGD